MIQIYFNNRLDMAYFDDTLYSLALKVFEWFGEDSILTFDLIENNGYLDLIYDIVSAINYSNITNKEYLKTHGFRVKELMGNNLKMKAYRDRCYVLELPDIVKC